MGQFSNGTEGMTYQAQYCDRCIHDAQNDCPIWNAHLMFNSSDVPQVQSILEILIPQREDGLGNEECSMFMLDPERARGAKVDEQYILWRKARALTGPEDEFDPAVNGDPDSTTGEEDDGGFDEMSPLVGWDDEGDDDDDDGEEEE